MKEWTLEVQSDKLFLRSSHSGNLEELGYLLETGSIAGLNRKYGSGCMEVVPHVIVTGIEKEFGAAYVPKYTPLENLEPETRKQIQKKKARLW